MKYKVTFMGKPYYVEVETMPEGTDAQSTATAAAPASVSVPAQPPEAPRPVPAKPVSAAPSAPAAGAELVTAPMPGNILSVDVAPGQAVKAGDVLVILEAMKMENEIVAPKDGTVSAIHTQKGAVVETGAPLVELS